MFRGGLGLDSSVVLKLFMFWRRDIASGAIKVIIGSVFQFYVREIGKETIHFLNDGKFFGALSAAFGGLTVEVRRRDADHRAVGGIKILEERGRRGQGHGIVHGGRVWRSKDISGWGG